MNSDSLPARLERWFFAAIIVFAIGALFAFGFESCARGQWVQGLILIASAVFACVATMVGLIAFADDWTQS
jgi:hypothetical protein